MVRTDEGMPRGIIRNDVGGTVYCTICHTSMDTRSSPKHSKRHTAQEEREKAREAVRYAIESANFVGSPEDAAFTAGSLSQILAAELRRRRVFAETAEALI